MSEKEARKRLALIAQIEEQYNYGLLDSEEAINHITLAALGEHLMLKEEQPQVK